jgi:hypothetical protein
MQYRLLLPALTLVLTGCGGGGGDSAPAQYQVSAQAGSGGSISPGSATVTAGQSTQFTVTPLASHRIDSVTGCNGSLTGQTYTTGSINTACSVQANFALKTYQLTASANQGGTITPASQTVAHGNSASFTLAPLDGYDIKSVTGCDGVLNGTSYTTAAVSAECSVVANFAPKVYQLTASASVGGTISPTTSRVQHGVSTTFTLTPDSDYDIESVTGCGGVLEGNFYKTAPITGACQVAARFALRKIQVTMQVGAGGTASITSQAFAKGTAFDVTFTPQANMVLSNASGCDGVLRDNVLRVPALTRDCTIAASFNSADVIVFPDANVDKKIRAALNLTATDAITVAAAATLRRLDFSKAAIRNLQGMQYVTGLTSLNLNNNQVTDLNPLRSLTQLTTLRLIDNATLADISPLAALTKLKTLDLQNTDVKDISALRDLQLLELSLAHSAVIDLSPVRNMALTKFQIIGSATSDLSPLANAPLETLAIDGSQVTDISMLTNLANLTYFNASNTPIADIRALLQAKRLGVLYLLNTKVTDVNLLAQLNFPQWAVLDISGCLDTNGYSRHLEVLNPLAKQKDLYISTQGASRRDCPDTLSGVSFSLDGTVSNRQLSYNWQISGTSQPFKCAIYLDLDDQKPNTANADLKDCAATGSQLLAERQADQFNLTMLFDNGIGGEKLVQLQRGSAPATPQLQSMDLSQITISSQPKLTAQRDGLLRLHITAAQSPSVLPTVTVQASFEGTSEMLRVNTPAAIPAAKVHRSLTDSYTAVVPARLMRAGLNLTVFMDGRQVQALTPTFAPERQLSIRMVPIQLGNKVATLPSTADVQRSVRQFWPFAEVNVRARAPYVLKDNAEKSDAYVMLQELSDLRVAEGEEVYYYGYFKPEMGDDCCGGLGYIGFPVAVGFDTDTDGTILAHELGHNFNRQHIDCGNPDGPDLAYPYDPASMGSVGLSDDFTSLKLPNDYKDVMSYCGPQHVSDYSVAAMQDFIDKNAPARFPTAASASRDGGLTVAGSPAGRSLYIAGSYAAGQLHIRTMLPLQRATKAVNASPQQRLLAKVQDEQGNWFSFTAQQLQLGHAAEGVDAEFVLEIPQLSLARLELWRAGAQLAVLDMRQATAARAVNGTDIAAQTASAAQTMSATQTKAADLAKAIQIRERSNEVCVTWPAGSAQTLSLIHQMPATAESNGSTVLALNETESSFCRPVTDLPTGGQWRVLWREQLQLREFVQPR